MVITAPATSPAIKWHGGSGTISLADITEPMKLPQVPPAGEETQPTPTDPGQVGAIDTGDFTFEASFNNGQTWRTMSNAAGIVNFNAATILAKNFSSSACLIRAVGTGATSGIGVLLGINGKGQ